MGKNKLKTREFSSLGCECPEPGYCYTIEHGGYKFADAPRAVYIDGIWKQEDPAKWLTVIQVPVEKA